MDGSALSEKAREAIENGKLPTRSPDRIMGGPGCGDACAICGESLRRNQMELEPEFRQDGEAAEVHKYHLHPRCFMAWESMIPSESRPLSSGLSAVGPEVPNGERGDLVEGCLKPLRRRFERG